MPMQQSTGSDAQLQFHTMNNTFALQNKVALVTGSGRGIGAAIARVFAEAGAAVVVNGRTAAQVEAVAAGIRAAGGRAVGITTDLSDARQLPGLIERTVAAFGGLDILVNNAGGGLSPPFVDTRIEHLESMFHLGVAVPFELSRLALPHLLDRPGASIINTCSPAVRKSPRGFLAHYVSKSALGALTKLMAADLGPRVRVNALVPGPVKTEQLQSALEKMPDAVREAILGHIRMRRLAAPEEIAYAAVYLASPAAAFITGTLLDVGGGDVDEIMPMSPDL
jgi:NAD(P)-dependent dehydrogenase (short-subunit alcohol dehydrogenase family)